ncbi:maltose O-acetyltransferase [Cryptococcus neoformans var. grubii Br795]|nr:maltose O-acetyltransferase [Cryptococcus neoformans var. grubii AD1-83a]OXG50675.1 maltose O-acetyltransferase [Cryptococcus neoformans var. grubii Th84]OXG59592.1 maltose O-acetyltransferase [Cryptococcus neoformans var. grubii MW-RSA1955]OXG63884.1 maltose O-acetyltransferase [Cryptococcus neoformans var. grubii c8]OXG64534.1 maltose O-acetyltransferase [Cryptococcus neoformans var. grubii CHC193]OXG82943.1 maltose O-acetyltransferase [Cryptococcus neoformans var. grubii Br795]OXG87717.
MILPHQSNSRIFPSTEDENPEELSQMLAGRPYHSWDSCISRIRDAQAREVWEINQIIDMEPRMKAMRDFIYMGDQAPNDQILTPAHPVSPEERNGLKGKEWAKPVTIGNDCWLGAGVTVCPGVIIGERVTVGAASVVTKDVPSRLDTSPSMDIDRSPNRDLGVESINMHTYGVKRTER